MRITHKLRVICRIEGICKSRLNMKTRPNGIASGFHTIVLLGFARFILQFT